MTNLTGFVKRIRDIMRNDAEINGDAQEKKEAIKRLFMSHGIDIQKVKEDQNMANVDDYDFICHIAFNQKPLTKSERAKKAKSSSYSKTEYWNAVREIEEALYG